MYVILTLMVTWALYKSSQFKNIYFVFSHFIDILLLHTSSILYSLYIKINTITLRFNTIWLKGNHILWGIHHPLKHLQTSVSQCSLRRASTQFSEPLLALVNAFAMKLSYCRAEYRPRINRWCNYQIPPGQRLPSLYCTF